MKSLWITMAVLGSALCISNATSKNTNKAAPKSSAAARGRKPAKAYRASRHVPKGHLDIVWRRRKFTAAQRLKFKGQDLNVWEGVNRKTGKVVAAMNP